MDHLGQSSQASNTADDEDHQRASARGAKSRGLSSRRTTPESRTRALASAIYRLEQEHVALLLALCDLEESSTGDHDPVMREALQQLLREDLRRTQHALRLASQGAYGFCEVCKQPLSRRHLSLLPAITRCWACTGRAPRGQ